MERGTAVFIELLDGPIVKNSPTEPNAAPLAMLTTGYDLSMLLMALLVVLVEVTAEDLDEQIVVNPFRDQAHFIATEQLGAGITDTAINACRGAVPKGHGHVNGECITIKSNNGTQ